MQQGGGGGVGGGGGGGSQSQSRFGVSLSEINTVRLSSEAMGESEHPQLVEAASPISSRPPAGTAVNLEELMRLSDAAGGLGADDNALGGVGGDEGGGGVGGGGGGNRWPRQETLALLKIRSDMDLAFRDATVKGPLWDDVSRKLAELGYKRSAKKCKEKFENVHKYYKRTKESRAGRQDGKSYKFFSQLEALQTTTTTAPTTVAVPTTTATVTFPYTSSTTQVGVATHVSVGAGNISNPMPISSVRISPTVNNPPPVHSSQLDIPSSSGLRMFSPEHLTVRPPPVRENAPPTTTGAFVGISFSSNIPSSSSPGSSDDDDDYDTEGPPSNTAGSSRKRKRGSGGSETRRMMEFFEKLMKQVMQKQEVMQQRFLEAIEKREEERMIREEAWKRQEMGRLSREQEVVAQERAISASRDASIIAFLQKITGQTIQLPPENSIPINAPPSHAPPPPPPPSVPTTPPPPPSTQSHPPPQISQHHQQQYQIHHHHHHNQSQPSNSSSQIVLVGPEVQQGPSLSQEIVAASAGGGSSFEPASSRWPKPEVLALIKIRSALESRYQEAGPKGPLWEEISAGMQRMGYKRNPKRCKEKWENINKYFKKVKESNKQRPEDAKTCPYFHELDALYRKKILGGTSGSGGGFGESSRTDQEQHRSNFDSVPTISQPQNTLGTVSESKNGGNSVAQTSNSEALQVTLFGEGTGGVTKKPADIVKELMVQHQQQRQQPMISDYDKVEEPVDSNNMDQEEDDDDEDDDDEDDDGSEDLDDGRKMGYEIKFQRQNGASSNGGRNDQFASFAMVQ